MLGKFLQKFSKKDSSNIKLEVPVPDFIPYACHYSPETILTKNGELIQTIKIIGFYNERIGAQKIDLRTIIKQAIGENIKSDDFSLWFHTVRRKQNLDPGGDFAQGFPSGLNKVWKQRNNWENQYVNEVYISIIKEGISVRMSRPMDILRNALFPTLKYHHEQNLKKCYGELTKVVDGMLKTLKPFGANRLSMVETQDGFFSEPLKFLSKILYLSEVPMPIPLRDLSEYLATHSIAFGFNTMEVHGITGKHFGAIFTIKEPQEIPGSELDKFLQLPQEFIITQTIDFIGNKQAVKGFKKQNYILEVSGATEFAKASGIQDVVDNDIGSSTDFGSSQVTIFLIDDNLKQLEINILNATEALKSIGIVATRRDLRMEECFWAQLPANFAHISRRKPINTKRLAALASLYNFPAGNRSGNLWGPAVTAFHTANGTPYFFNFHKGENGNTMIIGPFSAGKTVLMNFLVSEAQKYNGRLFFFDQMGVSQVFIKSMQGYYANIKPIEKNRTYAFNPFYLDDNYKNRSFLKKWLVYIADASGIRASEEEIKHIATLVDYIYTIPKEQRRFLALKGKFGSTGVISLEKRMEPWYGKGSYAHLFDNPGADITNFKNKIYGFGMSHVIQDQASLGPVLSYLLHQIETSLDGTPAVIVLDEAWNLINNHIFAPMVEGWLDRMKAANAIVILASENIKNAGKSEITPQITSRIATRIFLPNAEAEASSIAYHEVWGLSSDEFATLSAMNKDKRQFMLCQGDISIVASLNLSGMKELDILSGSEKTVKIMEEVISRIGENPEDWVPAFYEKMREIKGNTATENEKLFVV